eukprot:924224-Lingulodinium_polyedra.AAC.1
MYSAARLVKLAALVSHAGCPNEGVAAGCGFATYFVQVYLGEPVEGFLQEFPWLHLVIQIDDFVAQATDACEDRLASGLAESADALLVLIEEELG